MGVLFFAPDVRLPSVLWMRRMLIGLGSDVARLVTEKPPGEPWESRLPCAVVPWGAGAIARGALRRLKLVTRRIASPAQARWLAAQSNRSDVEAALVHYATLALSFERTWQLTDRPVFVHCHGYDVTWALRTEQRPHHLQHPRDYAARVRRLSERVTYIANSQHTAARLQEIGVPQERIVVKYLGVPVPAEFPRESADVQREEAAHARPLIRILYLGRLVDCKGPDLTIRAFNLARRQGLTARLAIAGDGPLRAECERLRAESPFADSIEILGSISAAAADELRAAADIFTAHNCLGPRTHQEEAFGVSIVEAMAAGLPIVSGRSGSLPEIIDDGEHGLLFPPGDVEAHAAALLKLAHDPVLRKELGRRAWQRANERFTLEQEMHTLRTILGLPVSAACVP